MAVDTRSFLISLAINAAVCIICFVVLSFLRDHKLTKRYFAPKRYADDVKIKPRKLTGLIGWVWQVWNLTEQEIVTVAGVDSAVFLRITSFGNQLFFGLTLWCLIVVLPVNVTDNYVQHLLDQNAKLPKDKRYTFSDIDKSYITNITPGSPRLWAHLLWQFNREVTALRLQYLSTAPKGGPSHTVLLTDIPGLHSKVDKQLERKDSKKQQEDQGKESVVQLLDADTDASDMDQWAYAARQLKACGSAETFVKEEMYKAYGTANVDGVNLVCDDSTLAPLVNKFKQVKEQLQDILDNYASLLKRNKPIKRKQVTVIGAMHGAWAVEKYGSKPVKVDAVEFYLEQLRQLMQSIIEEQPKSLGKKTPSSFVTFQNRYTQVVAATSMLSADETLWKARDAPGPEEVVWENLGLRGWERSLRSLVGWGIFVCIIIFYIPVIGGLQGFINIDQLNNTPGIKVLVKLPLIRDIIIGILPNIVMIIFLAILPMLLAMLCRRTGMVALSQIDFGVVKRYFIFQVMTVFIASAASGTFMANAKVIIANPSNVSGIFKLIATGLPQQATFFMTYLATKGLAGTSIGFLRVVGLVLFWVFYTIAGTKRAKTRLWANQTFLFGPSVPNLTMAIVFGLTFCVQAPIICPVALIFFLVQTIIYRYNLVYVYKLPYQSGGKMWAEIFSQIMFALYCFQVVIIFLLAVKKFPYTVLIAPIIPITIAFQITANAMFERPWRIMSLQAAGKLDRRDAKQKALAPELSENPGAEIAGEIEKPIRDQQAWAAPTEESSKVYLAPIFKIGQKDLEEVVQEAEEVMGKVKGVEAGDIILKVDKAGAGNDDDDDDCKSEVEMMANPLASGMEQPVVSKSEPQITSKLAAPTASSPVNM